MTLSHLHFPFRLERGEMSNPHKSKPLKMPRRKMPKVSQEVKADLTHSLVSCCWGLCWVSMDSPLAVHHKMPSEKRPKMKEETSIVERISMSEVKGGNIKKAKTPGVVKILMLMLMLSMLCAESDLQVILSGS